ncbi:hypothetical protein Mgra_00006256 [Meloidogyne graminicola]|uniref:Uncharacterized protein n=1 Tax=Meloidogyne graminicola TaxID=189291 RepID=A0A8S9ZLV4_9BILA|nr:hypothetical protein Mgra_00006256 [Meloidogyne graminicola]
MEWIQIILPFIFCFSVCIIICCGKSTKKQHSKTQENLPASPNKPDPSTSQQSPKGSTSPATQTATNTHRRLGGGPGSTIVPFSKEKMLWSSMMVDKAGDKKK